MDVAVEEVLQELADIRAELSDLPADDFARRAELRARRDRLRSQLDAYDPDAGRTRGELEAELAALLEQWQRLAKGRIDLVSQAGSMAGGEMGNLGGVALNREIDEAQGLTAIEARISLLRAKLASRD